MGVADLRRHDHRPRWLLLRAFRGNLGISLALVVAFPLLAALGFVVAISGFMFTEQLGWTLVTCLLIGVMLVPGSVLIGQQLPAARWPSKCAGPRNMPVNRAIGN